MRASDAEGRFLANAALGVAQGRPRRGRRRPWRVRRLVGGDGVQPRPGALPRGRADGGPAGPVRRRGRRRRGRPRAPGRDVGVAGDRPVGLVRRVVGQDRPGARRPEPGRRAVLRHHRARADRRRRRAGAAAVVAAGAGVRPRAGRRQRQHRRRARQRGAARCPPSRLSEVLATSDVPGGVVNILTGRTAEVAPWLASHRDVNAIDLAGCGRRRGRRLGRPGARGGRQPQAGAASGRSRAPARWSRTGRRTPDLSRMRAFLETKTVWHPKGR